MYILKYCIVPSSAFFFFSSALFYFFTSFSNSFYFLTLAPEFICYIDFNFVYSLILSIKNYVFLKSLIGTFAFNLQSFYHVLNNV